MKFILAATLLLLSLASPAQASCNIKGVRDAVDGNVYYTAEHRLHKYVKALDRKFCSADDAEAAGFRPALKSFSNSTIRLLSCVKNADRKCENYVVGQYRSLAIYDRVCPKKASRADILDAFVSKVGADKSLHDAAKFNGTTAALMAKFSCR